jgi:hypothetical protein
MFLKRGEKRWAYDHENKGQTNQEIYHLGLREGTLGNAYPASRLNHTGCRFRIGTFGNQPQGDPCGKKERLEKTVNGVVEKPSVLADAWIRR